MPIEQFANVARTTLAGGGISNVATTMTVTDATGFPPAVAPNTQFRIKIESEFMIVTNASGATWTVTRGAETSTAVAHAPGVSIIHVLTAGAATALNNVHIQALQPTLTTPYLWIQTGLGADGSDVSFWIEDGT